jgi:hypothetical protein
VEILPFIQVIMVMVWEFYLQSAFDSLSELFIKASHVHLVALYVGEAPLVNEELANTVRATLLT